jgi:hypothetical protein
MHYGAKWGRGKLCFCLVRLFFLRPHRSTASLPAKVASPWSTPHSGLSLVRFCCCCLQDTALGYNNQVGIGKALKASSRPRDSYFITSKIPGGMNYSAASAALELGLSQLALDYVDLMLVHFPATWEGDGGKEMRVQTWAALEDFVRAGKSRAIGVSHYCINHIKDILEVNTLPIAVNQVRLCVRACVRRARVCVRLFCGPTLLLLFALHHRRRRHHPYRHHHPSPCRCSITWGWARRSPTPQMASSSTGPAASPTSPSRPCAGPATATTTGSSSTAPSSPASAPSTTRLGAFSFSALLRFALCFVFACAAWMAWCAFRALWWCW